MNIIPAIDLLGSKAVRLHQGRYDEVTVYDDAPPRRALEFRKHASRLHVVDLEGAKAGKATQIETVKAIVAAFGPGVQVGGGVRSKDSFESYLALGASKVVLGSMAIQRPELVRSLAQLYPHTVILAVDAKDGFVATDGWTQVSSQSAVDVVRHFADVPLGGVLYTDISRDGTRVGPNVAMTAELARHTPFEVIASGGVGSLEHLRELAETKVIGAAIVGRAIYDGSVSLEEATALVTA